MTGNMAARVVGSGDKSLTIGAMIAMNKHAIMAENTQQYNACFLSLNFPQGTTRQQVFFTHSV